MDKICTSGRIRSSSRAHARTRPTSSWATTCRAWVTGEIPWVRTPSSPTGRKIPLCSSCTRTEGPFVGVHREVTALSQLKMIPPAPTGLFPFSKISRLQLTSWTRCANRRLCAVCAQMLRCSNASGQSLGKVLDQA